MILILHALKSEREPASAHACALWKLVVNSLSWKGGLSHCDTAWSWSKKKYPSTFMTVLLLNFFECFQHMCGSHCDKIGFGIAGIASERTTLWIMNATQAIHGMVYVVHIETLMRNLSSFANGLLFPIWCLSGVSSLTPAHGRILNREFRLLGPAYSTDHRQVLGSILSGLEIRFGDTFTLKAVFIINKYIIGFLWFYSGFFWFFSDMVMCVFQLVDIGKCWFTFFDM